MYCEIYNNGLYNTLLTCPTYWCLSNCMCLWKKDRCESVQRPRYAGRSLHTNHHIDHLKMCKSCSVDKGRLHFIITMQLLNLSLLLYWNGRTIRKRGDIVFYKIYLKYILSSWIFWFDIVIFCICIVEFCFFRVHNHTPSLSISLFHKSFNNKSFQLLESRL